MDFNLMTSVFILQSECVIDCESVNLYCNVVYTCKYRLNIHATFRRSISRFPSEKDINVYFDPSDLYNQYLILGLRPRIRHCASSAFIYMIHDVDKGLDCGQCMVLFVKELPLIGNIRCQDRMSRSVYIGIV
eukprot:431978_1